MASLGPCEPFAPDVNAAHSVSTVAVCPCKLIPNVCFFVYLFFSSDYGLPSTVLFSFPHHFLLCTAERLVLTWLAPFLQDS